MADVFISYSKTRAAEARELADELGDLGYDVWWDTSLLPTGTFGEEIDRQLDAAKAVIVIWSPESVRSKWVRSEAAHADREDKLVNTHTAGVDPVRQIPKPFEQTHSVALDNIRAIVAALDVLKVPRSGGRAGGASVAGALTSATDTDDRLFAEVERTGTAEAYEYYLDAMPEGRHALIARFRLKAHQPPLPSDLGSQLRPPWERDGRIKVDAKIVHGAIAGWFMPGEGKMEWFKDLDVGPEMVVVPAGSFTMGSSPAEIAAVKKQFSWSRFDCEGPQRTVAIKAPFAVGRFAITFDEWEAAGLSHTPEDRGFGRGRRPVINVSWEDAQAYMRWLSEKTGKTYRLLSEAEWEYCCRAGTTTKYAFGDDTSQHRVQATGGTAGTVEVGKFLPNDWGLYDMHGNVREWCQDNWHPNYQGAPQDGSVWTGGDATMRVLRGGSWIEGPGRCYSADRNNEDSTERSAFNGFRLARAL